MDDDQRQVKTAVGESRETSPWALAGLGMQFFVGLLVSVYVGHWLDGRFGTEPMLLLVGVFVGGGGTFFLSVRRLTRAAARGTTKEVSGRSRT